MAPRHRQSNAPRRQQSGNALQALTDPQERLQSWQRALTTELVDCVKNGTIEDFYSCIAHKHDEYAAANLFIAEQAYTETQQRFDTVEESIRGNRDAMYSRFDNLMMKMSAVINENNMLRKAYDSSREETAALKTAVEALTKKMDDYIAIPPPPAPDLTAFSTTVEEMTRQLSVVHHEIQDVLEVVRSPPGKRMQLTGHEDIETTTGQPATNEQQQNASPQDSVMHLEHATTAAQEEHDAEGIKDPSRPLAITLTEESPNHLPDGSVPQDTTQPEPPTIAPANDKGWKTVEGKSTRRKRKSQKAGNQRVVPNDSKPPTTRTGGRGKNTHQHKPIASSTTKTWVEVVKSGGINIQIVLGNDNIRITTPTARTRGEWRGGAANRRDRRNRAAGDREKGGRDRGCLVVV